MKMQVFCVLVFIVLLLEGVHSQTEAAENETSSDSPTKLSTDQKTTTITDAPSTTIYNTTTEKTTDPQTSTSSTAQTTTTTVTTTTEPMTTRSPVIGRPCSNDTQCKSIENETVCHNGTCECSAGYFNVSNTKCSQESALTPQIDVTDCTMDNINISIGFHEDGLDSLPLIINVSAKAGNSDTTDCLMVQRRAVCSSLVPGTQYTVTVLVDYQGYMGNNSIENATKPAPVTELNVTASSKNASVTWTKPRGRVEYYMVYLSNRSNKTNETFIVYSNLQPATHYTVSIVAHSNGQESEAVKQSFSTKPDVPGRPTDLIVTDNTSSSVTLRWTAPVTPNGIILGYEIHKKYRVYRDDDYTVMNPENTTDNGTKYVVSNLTAGTFYVFDVYTINEMYKSMENASVEQRTVETVPGPVNITVTSGSDFLHVEWERPTVPNGDIVAYRLQWQEENSTENCSTVWLMSENYTGSVNTNCSNVYPNKKIEDNKRKIEHNITQLNSYRKYIIEVTAYTNDGGGQTAKKVKQTAVAIPDPVTNVRAVVTGNTTVNVSWALPSDNPGPVMYRVIVKDMVADGNSYVNYSGNCTFEGRNSTSCEVGGLNEYWVYSFLVNASTDAGFQLSNSTNNRTTQAGKPGVVSGVTATAEEDICDGTSMYLNWSEPGLLDRNSEITKYLVLFNYDTGPKYWTFNVVSPVPYAPGNRSFAEKLTRMFKGETRYIDNVIYAVSNDSVRGMGTHFSFTTGVCKPPAWEQTSYGDIKSSRVTTGSVQVSLPAAFYTDNHQGALKNKGMVVGKTKEELEMVKVEGGKTWHEAKAVNFQIPYIVKLQDSDLSRRRRSVQEEFSFEIGANSSCTVTTNLGYCNGPLPDNFRFYVVAFVCTSAGCTMSPAFGAFSTAKIESPSTDSPWLIPVIVLAVIAVCLLAVLVLMFLKGVNPRKWLPWKKQPGTHPPHISTGDLINVACDIPENRPLSLANYDEELVALHKDTNLLFSDQYGDLGRLSELVTAKSSFEAANMESNKAKNRWVNILPYDHSRVKLQQLDEDDPSSDYINANYIPGYNNKREYIATQGPLPGTIDDFWRMVWEHNVQAIVMLTQCKEGNRVKCEMYWPDVVNEPKQYGEIVVNPCSISTLSKYNITIFEISMNNQTRQVFHFHYLHFPDFSANVEFDVFIEFVQTVRSHIPHDMVGPTVVHCSAGVGRTGTFIAVDRLDQMMRQPDFSFDQTVDIFDIVMSMRKNRLFMVQTESQYIMIHDCLQLMLETKKQAMESQDDQDDLYINEAFDPYPENLYENVMPNGEPKTEL